jgi:hypothetical protein
MQFKERDMVDGREELRTLHFARFVELHDHNQLGYFTVFDGDFRNYLADFIPYLGPAFDLLFKHVVDGPPVPCERNIEAFIDWSSAHHRESIGFYSAYPALSVKEIRTQAAIDVGGIESSGQSSLTLPLRAKSPTHFAALTQSLTGYLPDLYAALDAIGTVNFFRWVPLDTQALIVVAEYGGKLQELAECFSTHLGPVFDEIFQKVFDCPALPVGNNRSEFTAWITRRNLKTWGLYSAYPSLSVQRIRAMGQA